MLLNNSLSAKKKKIGCPSFAPGQLNWYLYVVVHFLKNGHSVQMQMCQRNGVHKRLGFDSFLSFWICQGGQQHPLRSVQNNVLFLHYEDGWSLSFQAVLTVVGK